MSMTDQTLWAGIVALCVTGLIYFGGEAIRDEYKINGQKPWRWGDAHRRAPKEATWGSHLALGVATFMLVIFVIGILKRM